GFEASAAASLWVVVVGSGAASSSPVPAQPVNARAPTAAPRVSGVMRVSLFIIAPVVITLVWTVHGRPWLQGAGVALRADTWTCSQTETPGIITNRTLKNTAWGDRATWS